MQNKYQVILDNMLDVLQNDASIFTNVDNKKYFDIFKILKNDDFNKLVRNKEFEISLINDKINNLITKISNANSIDEVNDILVNQNKTNFAFNQIGDDVDLNVAKQKINNELSKRYQKSLRGWNELKLKVNEILDESNVWSLHIGFLFVRLKKDEKAVYAPLFLKEVEIVNRNNKPYLRSKGGIKINEKLIFWLNAQGFQIKLDENFEDYTIFDLRNKIKNDWHDLYQLPIHDFDKFLNVNPDTIINENIVFYSGTVLGIFMPSGGYSRNRMKEIIENNEIDSIINVDFNKNKYKNTVNNHFYTDKFSLWNITKTNNSQDTAIFSALLQNTVIWGPPGTGKSETIINLISNILVNGSTAVIASQKKAALDVIKERLGTLSSFCLFLSDSKILRKEEFYKPIREYIDYLENYNLNPTLKDKSNFTEGEKQFILQASELFKNPKMSLILKAYYYLYRKKEKVNLNTDIEYIMNLPKDIFYPSDEFNTENNVKKLISENKLKYMFFLKKYWNVANLAKDINIKLPDFNGNLQDLTKFFNAINYDGLIFNNNSPFKQLNNLILLSKNLRREQTTYSRNQIKEYVAGVIFNKVNKFNDKQMKRYKEFAQSVKVENYQPYKFVKEYIDIIKDLFPIIVATPDTDLSGWSKEEFDYSILDESSQMFIENGLPILYLSKVKILAGDIKQMRPSNWFGSRNTDDTIFGKVESLLDYVISLGVYQTILNKNYRSNYASLMAFSSKYFYESNLDVVDSNIENIEEPIELYEVDGVWSDNKNIAEANKVFELLKENINDYKKIIILGFNAKQSDYITSLIFEDKNNYELFGDKLNNRELLIRNVENIQGDEADLIIATVAYDQNTKLSSTYICRENGKNALNVAVSRAKSKMIVVKTIKSKDIQITQNSTSDLMLFKNWLDFLESGPEGRRNFLKGINNYAEESTNNNNDFEIWFKKYVINHFEQVIKNDESFEIIQNYSVGSVTFDFVVLKNKRVYKAFIFDAFNYDKNIKKYALKRDKLWFLQSKKYDVNIISPISWIEQQKLINIWFEKDENITQQQTHVLTNSYMLNKNIDLAIIENENQLNKQNETLDQEEEIDFNENNIDLEQEKTTNEINDINTQFENNDSKSKLQNITSQTQVINFVEQNTNSITKDSLFNTKDESSKENTQDIFENNYNDLVTQENDVEDFENLTTETNYDNKVEPKEEYTQEIFENNYNDFINQKTREINLNNSTPEIKFENDEEFENKIEDDELAQETNEITNKLGYTNLYQIPEDEWDSDDEFNETKEIENDSNLNINNDYYFDKKNEEISKKEDDLENKMNFALSFIENNKDENNNFNHIDEIVENISKDDEWINVDGIPGLEEDEDITENDDEFKDEVNNITKNLKIQLGDHENENRN
ncbi:AAA domain-containing protein [Mycoplasma sp. OR1901]|uniref:AAA domain-containing protein n=1 Tax=Mycoplasma sp. OR1901 TaxID=2742195 RepID=UPI0015827910|nr:AAA domain-containing protein [Mycoplasma sp. OR1901]QKT05491.1 ATP-dependent helicase [Mycoplasma sp. OR1901]